MSDRRYNLSPPDLDRVRNSSTKGDLMIMETIVANLNCVGCADGIQHHTRLVRNGDTSRDQGGGWVSLCEDLRENGNGL